MNSLVLIESVKSNKDMVMLFHNNNSGQLFKTELIEGKFHLSEAVRFEREGHQYPVRTLKLSSDDSTCLSVSTESVKLWNIVDKPQVMKSLDLQNIVSAVILPKDQYAVLGSKEGNLILVDLRNG